MNRSPWFTMWTQPRATMAELLAGKPQPGMVALLAMLTGISDAYNKASTRGVGESFGAWTWLPILVGGAIGGYVLLYLAGWLLTMVGRWNGGTGSQEDVRRAWAWSSIPMVWSLPLIFVELGLYGNQVFAKDPEPLYGPGTLIPVILSLIVSILDVIVGIWSLVVFFKCLAQAHSFSTGKAFATTVYSMLLVAGTVLLFGILIVVIT
ncbi:Yip1 family protein [Tumebacillus flagellatus]|uniref:Yip1 domain-containing protein n=1 Tax=Tumebacillus flagellatus TaxID=1157490 RepID=A0A074MHV2_9BACL|nr:Yip1 family protein [Tumebacillus flagellatus]KEO85267.1 hypothetical protein EL26_01530 [Tumebacillus flagellatus]